MSKMYDIAVIGGGPAGYIAAIKGAMLGASTILFEKDTVGGTCLNRGCIPTKTYVKTAEYIKNIEEAEERGIINNKEVSVDMKKVVSYKDTVVKKLTGGVSGLLRSHGVEVVKGVAKMKTETEIECDGQIYNAKNTILAGGSKPTRIPIKGIDNPSVLTSNEILDLKEVPKELVIVGGGVIGCEIATAFNSFGSNVTIVELDEHLVPNMDIDISIEMKNSLERLGIKILVSKVVDEILENDNKTFVMISGEKVEADKILMSTGRMTDIECLGALSEKIRTEKGKVIVDEYMATSIKNIYAPGDINGKSMLAHAAFKMGEVAASNCMGHKEKIDLSAVPGCVYTLPEAASVGLNEKLAKEKYGQDIVVGKFPFAANGRALASGETEGFIKVIVEKKYSEILGVHIFGGVATEMIAEAVSLINMEITANEVANIIHGHPTYSEAFMEACADALGECLHLPKK